MEDTFTLFIVRDIVVLFQLLLQSNELLSAQNIELRWFSMMQKEKTMDNLAKAIANDQVYA